MGFFHRNGSNSKVKYKVILQGQATGSAITYDVDDYSKFQYLIIGIGNNEYENMNILFPDIDGNNTRSSKPQCDRKIITDPKTYFVKTSSFNMSTRKSRSSKSMWTEVIGSTFHLACVKNNGTIDFTKLKISKQTQYTNPGAYFTIIGLY